MENFDFIYNYFRGYAMMIIRTYLTEITNNNEEMQQEISKKKFNVDVYADYEDGIKTKQQVIDYILKNSTIYNKNNKKCFDSELI